MAPLIRKGTPLDRLRAICLSLPATKETITWGHPNFRVGEKIFAAFESYRGRECVCFKTIEPIRLALLEDERYFIPPYSGRFGWVARYVDGRVSWKKLEGLLQSSYRMVAPTRTLKSTAARKTRRPKRAPGS
ncbi:MAG: MmcQ/YjbR family DNA-binding protein [Acidobacteria bacterium]|nr:MmcQ/YjbR family DNA-binding protein [Acidobacteriota bacterium]